MQSGYVRFCLFFFSLSLYCINYDIPSYIFILLTIQQYFCCCSATQLMSDSVTQWTAACQTSLSFTISRSLHTLLSIEFDDAIQSFHPPSSPSPPALNLSQHQGLLKIPLCNRFHSFYVLMYIPNTLSKLRQKEK